MNLLIVVWEVVGLLVIKKTTTENRIVMGEICSKQFDIVQNN